MWVPRAAEPEVGSDPRADDRVAPAADDHRDMPANGRVAEIEIAPSMTQAAFSMVMQPYGRRRVFVSPLERLAPRALSDELDWVGYSVWSPDEKSIAQGEMMPPGAPNVYVRYPGWSSRGNLVVFERGELRGNIWTLPVR